MIKIQFKIDLCLNLLQIEITAPCAAAACMHWGERVHVECNNNKSCNKRKKMFSVIKQQQNLSLVKISRIKTIRFVLVNYG
jgi:hypothetical protein